MINPRIGYNNELNKWTLNYISSNEYGYLNRLKNCVISVSEKLLDYRSKPKTMIFRVDFEFLYLGFLKEIEVEKPPLITKSSLLVYL